MKWDINDYKMRFMSNYGFSYESNQCKMASEVSLSELQAQISDNVVAMDTGWVIFCGSMVFITQLGFFQLEAGHVNEIWIHSIILKNFEDAFAGILLFSLFGYAIVESESELGIWGFNFDYFFLWNVNIEEYVSIFYQSLYAIASTTIVSSCVLERIKNKPYLCVIFFMTMIQFPLLSHWVWNKNGWLNRLGYIDFSGGSVVHISGGIVGLILILYLGNRQYVSDYTKLSSRHPGGNGSLGHHTLKQSAIGIFLLWFGWYGFNCGSAMSITDDPLIIGRIAINTSLCSASGGATTALLVKNKELSTIVNGVLIGLVSATTGSHLLQPWAAVLTGSIAGIVIVYWKQMMKRRGIDDPLSATAVHIGGGLVSCICLGLFRIDEGLVYGQSVQFFGIQLLGLTIIVLSSFISSLLLCFILETTVGLRVDIFSGYLDVAENRNNVSETLNIAVTVRTPTTNAWLWHFHKFLEKRLSFEQLDFLVACTRLINKIEYFEEKFGIGVFMQPEKEKIILDDRNALIELYLEASSDYVVNVSHAKLQFFKKEKKRLKPFELKTVLFEVYLEILRMLQIPFAEWLREYWQNIQIKKENKSKRGKKINIARISLGGESDGFSTNEPSENNNSKYRKVYHVGEDYKIDWKVVRYSATDHCWFCTSILPCCGGKKHTNNIRASRPSIVLPKGMSPKQFRMHHKESFMKTEN